MYLVVRELLSNCSNECNWKKEETGSRGAGGKTAGVSPEPEGAGCGKTTVAQYLLV